MKTSQTSLLLPLLALLALPMQAQEQVSKGRDTELHYRADSTYTTVTVTPVEGQKVKNIVLMIGDGMSLSHIASLAAANHGRVNLFNATHIGLSKTDCANRLITDSGAAGTAMACGQKTNYHMVGTDSLGRPLRSITDLAHDKGLGTGIVVTCRLYDATPSTFVCHNPDRDQEYEVAADYAKTSVDIIIGGGRHKFTRRDDGRNIVRELAQRGYATPKTLPEVLAQPAGTKIFALLDSVDLPVPAERGDYLTRASIKTLDNLSTSHGESGFFVMIEGSQLDDYGHFNDLDLLMQETADFDRCAGAVMQWAERNGETLVIITADHETGGLTLVGGDHDGKIVGKFSTGGHSGILVPVYAYGPGADEFTGVYENTEIFEKCKKLLGL